MARCNITKARQQLRPATNTGERFSTGNPDCGDDTPLQLQPAEFGFNVVDNTLEIAIDGNVFQVPCVKALAANNGQATIWDETNKKFGFGTGDGILNILLMSDLKTTEVQLTPEQSGSIIILDDSGTIRVPTAAVLGMNYKLLSESDLAADILIKAIGANFIGGLLLNDRDSALASQFFTDAADDTITFNGTTRGGNTGSVINLVYTGNDWNTTGVVNCSGVVANPFS